MCFIGEVTEKTAETAAKEVSLTIEALPSEEELQSAEEQAFETYRKQIEAAKRLYEGLSGFGKTLVENAEKLTALARAAEYSLTPLFDWSNASDLITAGTYEYWAMYVTVNKLTDADYGNGWQITRIKPDEAANDVFSFTEMMLNKKNKEE